LAGNKTGVTQLNETNDRLKLSILNRRDILLRWCSRKPAIRAQVSALTPLQIGIIKAQARRANILVCMHENCTGKILAKFIKAPISTLPAGNNG